MTREEIKKLEGVPLRIAIAWHVMGWKWMERTDPNWHRVWLFPPDTAEGKELNYPIFGTFKPVAAPAQPYHDLYRHPKLPDFPGQIAAAWRVVEKFNGDFEIRQQNGLIYRATAFIPSREFECWASTAPLAICRCALIATFDAATSAPAAGRGAK